MSTADDLALIAENVQHIVRGCRSGLSHNPEIYEHAIDAALDRVRDALTKLEAVEEAAHSFWGHFDGDYRDIPDTGSNLYVARFRALETALAAARSGRTQE